MNPPSFHPALDGLPEELEALRVDAARYGVSVEDFAFAIIHEVSAIILRNGSSSQALNAAMERAHAECLIVQ